jgi:tRNA(adenine34) deaminase
MSQIGHTPPQPQDEAWMRLALAQAQAAARANEVPVGAVLVHQGRVIAQAHNAPIATHDPTAHAEVVALRQAAQALENYRLEDATLYVTLEPCAMCSGALLNARLKRVVFGAHEPRTGAAGSVLDLFAHPALNAQTQVTSGVLAQDAAALLQSFFKARRSNLNPLREDALRTAASRFEGLTDYPWTSRWVSDWPVLHGWRLHYIDEQDPRLATADAFTYVCVHGPEQWSYDFRHLFAKWVQQGHRVVAPDLIGFGQSDKPKKKSVHTGAFHCDVLHTLITQLDLQRVVWAVSETAMPWAKALREGVALDRVHDWQVFDLSGEANRLAQQAPFPDQGHRAGPQALALL